jgi:hypothetical protein
MTYNVLFPLPRQLGALHHCRSDPGQDRAPFANLKVSSLDRLSLQSHMADIGKHT